MKNKDSTFGTLLEVIVDDENRKPPLIFHLPEPDPTEKVAKSKGSGRDHIRGFITNGFYGTGRCIRYNHYNTNEPISFYSIPLEPVIALRIQVTNDSYTKYVGMPDSKGLWPEDQCRLFWQGEEVIKNHLLPGEHTHFDIFFRPSVIEELADQHPKIKELAQQIGSAKYGELDFYVHKASLEVENFVFDFSPELFTEHITVERLNYLCDCILLLSLGVELEVEPAPPAPPEEENEEVEKKKEILLPKRYEPSEEESAFLEDIDDLDQEQLLAEFKSERSANETIEQYYSASKKLMKALRDRDNEKTELLNRILYSGYFTIARRLGELADTPNLGKKNLNKVKKAIIKACDNALESTNLPMPDDLEFYTSWTKQPYFSKGIPMDSGGFGDILSMLMPEMKMDTSEMDPTHDVGALFMQRLQETFGFQPSSHFSGEKEIDKPIEVVELYNLLMDKLSDNLTISDDGDIQRNDIIRLLDHAYERNDYLALLNLEVKYLTADSDYLSAQSPDKLRWYLTAMHMANEDSDFTIEKLMDDPNYHYLQFRSEDGTWTEKSDIEFEKWLSDKFIAQSKVIQSLIEYDNSLKEPSIDEIMQVVDELLVLAD